MRPAVSVGGAPALDGFNLNNFEFQDLDHVAHSQYELRDLFDHSFASDADRQFVENGLPVVANQFNSEIDHMAHYNDSIIDGFTFDDFINDNDQPAPEIQSSDSLAETTASLQPQLGASS